jgi:hypothetical protein
VLTLTRIVALLARFQAFQACEVDDWALDNVRDTGAESVGVSCDDSRGERPLVFILVGPDWLTNEVTK